MGDPTNAQELFKKGDMRNTRSIIRFDLPRAEKIAEVEKGFSGGRSAPAAPPSLAVSSAAGEQR